jgi:CRP-like cAMP-binding protein
MSGTDRAHELAAFLAGISFFASFDTGVLVWLAPQLEPVHALAGDAIIAEGDPGDGLYVLLSGRLRVTVGERVLHDLGRGAVIGEIALLSDRMRSATVRAVRDSDLLLLRTSSFKALIEQNPGFLAQMARLLIERLLAVDRPQPYAGNRAITVAPAGRDPAHAKAIAVALTDRLTGSGATMLLDSDAIDRQLGPGAAERGPSHPRRNELTGWLDGSSAAMTTSSTSPTPRTPTGANSASARATWRCWPAAAPTRVSAPSRNARSPPGGCAASSCSCTGPALAAPPAGCRSDRWRTITTSATDTRRTSPGWRAWSPARRAASCSAAAAPAVSRISASCTPSRGPACPSTSSAGPASAR